MIYENGTQWAGAEQKKVLLFAMSGLGKTYISSILRHRGNWFHYSVDYRIGTRYLGEHIVDNYKKYAIRKVVNINQIEAIDLWARKKILDKISKY